MRGARALFVVLGAVGCRFDASGFGMTEATDETAVGSGAASSGPGTPVESSSDGGTQATLDTSGTGEPGSGSTSEPGTTGSSEPALVGDGLLARWYLDEAGAGQGPRAARDHHPPAVDLQLAYGMDSPVYDETDDGLRGLRWMDSGRNGRAFVAIAGTEIEGELAGAARATFELVVAATEVDDQTSRFLHVGTGNGGGDFAIGSRALGELELRWGEVTVRRFTADLTKGRKVIHVVVDTGADAPEDRLLAYLDGVRLLEPEVIEGGPVQGEGLPLERTSDLVLGNRTDGMRSFRGRLQYAAIYTEILSPEQIEDNRDLLVLNDDAP